MIRAREEASLLARGNLLDNSGRREPARPIFELESHESLDDALGHGDGLYITKKTVDGSTTLNF
jgi:hypothetical protein